MPPVLALNLGLLFSAWLLIRDIKRRRSLSNALWIPTVLLLILGSRPISLWFSSGRLMANPGDYLEGSPIDRTFYLALIGASFLVTLRRGVRWGEVMRLNGGLFLFYGYLLVSVLWSEYSFTAFKRWVKDFGSIAVILVVCSEKAPGEAIRAIYARCAYLLTPLSIVFIKYYPQWGRSYTIGGEPMFSGVTTQKNSLGELVLVTSLFLVWDCLESLRERTGSLWQRIPWDRFLVLAMNGWLLVTSQSKTALLCLLVGLGLFLRPRAWISRGINRLVLGLALSLPFVLFLTSQFADLVAPVVRLVGRDLTFTGRTAIWQEMLEQPVNPLVGSGFYSFYLTDEAWDVSRNLGLTSLLGTAHNGYLDMYLDGGLIGVGILMLLLFRAGSRLGTNMSAELYQRLCFAFLLVSVLYNLSESMFGRLSFLWVTTLLVVMDWRGNVCAPRPMKGQAQQP